MNGVILAVAFGVPQLVGELGWALLGLALSLTALLGGHSVWWLRGGYERSAAAYMRHRAAYASGGDVSRDA